MKLIAGLGNPGRKYDGTRHNIGFDIVDCLAGRLGDGRYKEDFQGEVTKVALGDEQLLLVKPMTYMNLSGNCVGKAVDFYKIERKHVLVVCDDFHLPAGKLRLRAKGSSGGQKGLANIIQRLGSEEVSRLRVGVGPVDEHMKPADFVLRKFAKSQQELVRETIERSADAATCWVEFGIQEAMNRYNGTDET
ncbi:MAG: aminoacyl-tRNA hydrolase [Pirellulales bacterium]|nr:aminoacyl-tRNA hydrolase [Pirellulales bacterium]